MKIRYLFLIFLCAAALWVVFVVLRGYTAHKEMVIMVEAEKVSGESGETKGLPHSDNATQREQEQEKRIVKKEVPRKLQWSVPFVVQAPHAQWEDELFQDACEEASVLMAGSWYAGREKKYSKDDATQELEKMFVYEQERYGQAFDLSAADTAVFLQDYYDVQDIFVVYDIAINDIVLAISEGNLVIVPSDGRKLDNPYFTQPGPERHMLVITGYDQKKKEFITNDPGTRRGEDFRYDFDVLIGAVRDYPTGHKEPITQERTAMIVVGRSDKEE